MLMLEKSKQLREYWPGSLPDAYISYSRYDKESHSLTGKTSPALETAPT